MPNRLWSPRSRERVCCSNGPVGRVVAADGSLRGPHGRGYNFDRSTLTKYPRLAATALLLAVVSCAGPKTALYPPKPGEKTRSVYVINHGLLHTGLAVKRSDIPRGTWPANRDYARFKYLEVGWGDDDGYRKPLTTGIAIRALAGSKRTVMLSDGFNSVRTKVETPKFSVVEVQLSDGGFSKLCQHIEQTYALDQSGRPIRLSQGWYRATGTYSAFYTCNTWVASALRKAGCPITPGYCLTSSPLLFQVRQFGIVVR
jgi:hypothetical protein